MLAPLEWATLLAACSSSPEPAHVQKIELGARARAILLPLETRTVTTEDGFEILVECRGEARLLGAPDGTNLTLRVSACDFKVYAVMIHNDGPCDGALGADTRWDRSDSQDDLRVTCTRGGQGDLYYKRTTDHISGWSFGELAADSVQLQNV